MENHQNLSQYDTTGCYQWQSVAERANVTHMTHMTQERWSESNFDSQGPETPWEDRQFRAGVWLPVTSRLIS